MKRYQSIARAIEQHYPLSIPGTALGALAVALLVGSLVTKDPYELVLALVAILVLLVLALLGKVQAAQLARYPIQWDTSAPLVAGPEPAEQLLSGIDIHPFLWFRIHFVVRGRLQVGRGASLYVLQESVAASTTGGAMPVTLSFPLCGLLDARGTLKITDIFGLSRARVGAPIDRRLTVLPAPFPEAIDVRVEASERSEEKQSQINSDEEKYYMREYAPGDRFRDINWKTSSRLAQLFTRIAPIALEQTKIIAIELRNYRPEGAETLDSIAHLNHLKSWLLTFMRTVKEHNPDFQFVVTTARGTTRISSKDEIDRFALVLGELTFQSEPSENGISAQTSEIYVFTTPFDRGLAGYLSALPYSRINIFRTLYPAEGTRGRPGDAATNSAANRSTVRHGPAVRRPTIARFRGQLPLPGFWVFRRDTNRGGAERIDGWLRIGFARRGVGLVASRRSARGEGGLSDPRVRVLGQEVVEPHVLSFS